MGSIFCTLLVKTIIISVTGAAEPTDHCIYGTSSSSSVGISSKVTPNAVQVCCDKQIDDSWQQLGTRLSYMLEKMHWKDVILISNDNKDVGVATSSVLNSYTRYTAYAVQNTTAVSQQVHRLFSRMNQHIALKIVVICNRDCMLEILRQANHFDEISGQQGYFTFLHNWLIVTEARHLPALRQNVQNVSNVAILTWQRKTFEKKTPCTELGQTKLLTVLWSSAGERKLRTIIEFESPLKSKSFFTKLQSLEEGILFPNMNSFNGKHFLVGTNPWSPFVIKSISSNGTVSYSGFCMEVLQSLSKQLNFRYTLVEPSDGQWGAMNNGSWTGLMGQLVRKDVDMVVAPFSSNYIRERYVDFVPTAMYLEEYSVLVKTYGKDDNTLQLFAKPFKAEVWLAVVLSVVLGGVVMWLLNRLSLCSGYNNPCQKRLANDFNLLPHALWFAGGAMIRQNSVLVPRNDPGRIFMAVWWLYCVILVAVYTGNLIAFISVHRPKVPFTSSEQMVEQNEYTFGTLGGTLLADTLELATSGVNKKIWTKMQEFTNSGQEVLSTNHSHHLHLVNSTRYGYLCDFTALVIAAAGDCSFKILPASNFEFDVMRFSIALQNNSAYASAANVIVLNMKDGGLMDRWKIMYWPKDLSSICTQENGIPPAVSLTHMSGVFTALAVLLAVCLAVLLCEILMHFIIKGVTRGTRDI